MTKKEFYVLTVLVVLAIVVVFYANLKLEKIEAALSGQSKSIQINNVTINYINYTFNIEKVEGNGNAIGNDNHIAHG